MISYIPKTAHLRQITTENVEYATSVDTKCPYCARSVNYRMEWRNGVNKVLMHSISSCPACSQKATFLYVINLNPNAHIHNGELFIYPKNDIRQPLSGIDANVNMVHDLKTAYNSTIDVYNAQIWPATAVLCRRVLEGVTMSIVPSEHRNKPLFKQLELLPDYIDLQAPILTLADALRTGGNFGAHFVAGKEPNQEVSKLMIDLLDYLIEYIYILPTRIQELHDKLATLGTSSDANQE